MSPGKICQTEPVAQFDHMAFGIGQNSHFVLCNMGP